MDWSSLFFYVHGYTRSAVQRKMLAESTGTTRLCGSRARNRARKIVLRCVASELDCVRSSYRCARWLKLKAWWCWGRLIRCRRGRYRARARPLTARALSATASYTSILLRNGMLWRSRTCTDFTQWPAKPTAVVGHSRYGARAKNTRVVLKLSDEAASSAAANFVHASRALFVSTYCWQSVEESTSGGGAKTSTVRHRTGIRSEDRLSSLCTWSNISNNNSLSSRDSHPALRKAPGRSHRYLLRAVKLRGQFVTTIGVSQTEAQLSVKFYERRPLLTRGLCCPQWKACEAA